MSWESKAQGFLLVMLLVSIANYIVGLFIPKDFSALDLANQPTLNLTGRPLHLKKINSQGHFSLHGSLLSENLFPQFSEGENFFTVFAIFFPAATGILAGSNISGDLKDPSVSIPKGTFAAIGITSVAYCFLSVALGAHSTRWAPGFYGQLINGSDPTSASAIDDFRFMTTGCDNFTNEYSSAACGFGWNYTIVPTCPIKGQEW